MWGEEFGVWEFRSCIILVDKSGSFCIWGRVLGWDRAVFFSSFGSVDLFFLGGNRGGRGL